MQASESPHPYVTAVFQWVATILGSSIVTLLAKNWSDQRKEKKRALAQSGVNEARVRSLDGETLRATGDKMLGLFDKIYQLNLDLAKERLRGDQKQMELEWAQTDNVNLKLKLSTTEARAVTAEGFVRQFLSEPTEVDAEDVRVAIAEAQANAADMFVQQLNKAAQIKGVSLADFTPKQLAPAKEKSAPLDAPLSLDDVSS